jgi:hypothetical protein
MGNLMVNMEFLNIIREEIISLRVLILPMLQNKKENKLQN